MSLLGMADMNGDGLGSLVESAVAMKGDPTLNSTLLQGQAIGLFFAKQSLRTWVSCEVAAIQLGAHPLAIRDDTAGMGTRESAADVGRVLDRYLDLLAMRVHDHSDLVAIDNETDVPVVNLLSDLEHPCQAVADMQTIAEHRPLLETRIAFLGDGNNVCHSLMLAGTALGADVVVGCPSGYEPNPDLTKLAGERTGSVTVTDDPEEAVSGADVVYTDVWASMGQESEQDLRRRHFAPFQVNEKLFALAKPDAIFMHCLPAHRGEEVTDGVMDHPRSVVFDQAENRLHSFKAILVDQLG